MALIKRIYLFVSFLFTILLAEAHQLRGIITDQQGEPVAYASVFVKNTTYGVASNIKGEYFMELQDGSYEIGFQAVGYEKKLEKIVISGSNKTLNVTLNSTASELSEVVVQANRKDPAYDIVKKASRVRRSYLKQVESYSCNVYIKASLTKEYMSRDTMNREEKKADTLENELTREKMNFIETFGQYHFQLPGKHKEIKQAVKDHSDKNKGGVNISVDSGDDSQYRNEYVNRDLFKAELHEADFNFYQSTLSLPSLGGVPYISPISPFGLTAYKFRLEEVFLEDGIFINKIEVIPRRTDAALFKGYIYITDSAWSIKAVDLEADKNSLYFFKHFRIMQENKQIRDSVWMPVREEFLYNRKEGKKEIIGNTLIVYSDYTINPEFPKNFFDNEISAILDDALEKDTTYWEGIRPITLKEDEITFIQEQDSIRKYHESYEYLKRQDSIENRIDIWDITLNGLMFQNSFKKRKIYVESIIASTRPMGVGGYRHALGLDYSKEFRKGYKLSLDGHLDYGFNNKDLKGDIGFSYTYLPKRFARFHGEYRNNYVMVNSYESFTAFLSRGNYVNDIFIEFGHEVELINGVMLDVGAEYGEKRPIDNLKIEKWTTELFGELNAPQSFEPYMEMVFDVKLKMTPFQKYTTAPYKKIILGSKWPTFTLHYKKGVPTIFGSSVNYDFLELKARHDIVLGTFGKSIWEMQAGQYLSSKMVRFADYKFFRGSDPWLFSSPIQSFQLLGPNLSTTNKYFQVNYAHNFNGTLLNKVPLLKKLKLMEAGGAAVLFIEDNNFRHGEFFVGLEKPFRIRKQLFKIGCYYVIADSNAGKFDNQIKFGIDFFNSFKNSWSW